MKYLVTTKGSVELPVYGLRMSEMTTISKEEYDELSDDSLFLSCLRGAGVDNWDGYSFAQEEYQKEKRKTT